MANSRDVSDRRLAVLRANGEDTKRTVAWRDAISERQRIERSAAFENFKARHTKQKGSAPLSVVVTLAALGGCVWLFGQGRGRS